MSNTATINRGGDLLSFTAQRGGTVLVSLHSVNPAAHLTGLSVPADALRTAVDDVAPFGSYTRHESPDLAHGGVTAAAIEKETEDSGGPLDETVGFWRSRWKEAADRADARELAAHQWKETARRLHQERRAYRADAKYEEARADTLGRAHRECHAQRDEARAELAKAEAQIEELNKEAQTYSDGLTEEIARAEKAEGELDHLATVLETTARQRDEADKRNARPLTPDAHSRNAVDFLAATLPNLADEDRDYLARILTKGAR